MLQGLLLNGTLPARRVSAPVKAPLPACGRTWLCMRCPRPPAAAPPLLYLVLKGPSGSGKTTLLDLMAGRKTSGKMKGDILYAGNRATRPFLRRFTGYVSRK
jgi:hypothetical protein